MRILQLQPQALAEKGLYLPVPAAQGVCIVGEQHHVVHTARVAVHLQLVAMDHRGMGAFALALGIAVVNELGLVQGFKLRNQPVMNRAIGKMRCVDLPRLGPADDK